MTILKQIISLALLNLALLFAGQYYTGLVQQQREHQYAQLAHLFLWQGVDIARSHVPNVVYNQWRAQVENKLPDAKAKINNNVITINYKSNLQDEPITLYQVI